MKRKDFIKIIKLRSCWRIDRRSGNYTLPNGKKLSIYVDGLVRSQMQLDSLGIRESGDLCFCDGGKWNESAGEFDDFRLMPDFEENEVCSYERMNKRIDLLIREIVG